MTALAIALLLNQGTRCTLLLRILVYLPWLLGGVASLIVWSWFLNPQFGWLNAILRAIYRLLGAIAQWRSGHAAQDWPMPGWLFSPAGCKPALVLIHLWSVGGPALILLAGLRRIPLELTECAMLDGAGRWGRLRHVTVPLLRPVLAFNAVIGVIYAMQSFTESLVLQNRAQHDNLVFVSHYLYRTAFESPYRMGRAAAAGSVLMVVIAVLIAPLLALSRRVGWLTDQPQ
ncbi:MAG: sugar ABC transporter permease [Phycisphaerales bacterium]|nr:sugar ABC transporter permease [Phycisphaerales bacterium]